jgi:hypothetical protein
LSGISVFPDKTSTTTLIIPTIIASKSFKLNLLIALRFKNPGETSQQKTNIEFSETHEKVTRVKAVSPGD